MMLPRSDQKNKEPLYVLVDNAINETNSFELFAMAQQKIYDNSVRCWCCYLTPHSTGCFTVSVPTLLISQSYVNITEYPFGHLISEAPEFFLTYETPWYKEGCLKKCRMNFWLIFNFSDFLLCFEFFHFPLGLPWQDICSHDGLP